MRWPRRSGRPFLRSIPLLFLLGGGSGCRCIPPGHRRVRHGSGVWPTVGRIRCSSGVCPACCRLEVPGPFFLGKVAFDLVGLGDGLPCLRVDSEDILLTLTDERAQLACAAPGVTPGDSSEKGAPVRELILPSVLGEPLADCLQEPMSFEQVYRVESGDVDFDSFGMAPWDAGGMYSRTLGEPYRTRMLQWLMRLLCRMTSNHERTHLD